MSLEELKECRSKLRSDVEALVRKFEENTGVMVSCLRMDQIDATTFSGHQVKPHFFVIKVDLDL